MGQGFTLIYRFELVWMDEFVFKPRESYRVKTLDQPVDHAADPGDMAATGMKGQPNIERPAQFDLERYYFPTQYVGVGREHADPGAIGNRPVISAAYVGFHHQQILLGITGKPALEGLPGGGLVGDLHHQPVPLGQFFDGFRRAERLDVFLAGTEHQMHAAEPDQFDAVSYTH